MPFTQYPCPEQSSGQVAIYGKSTCTCDHRERPIWHRRGRSAGMPSVPWLTSTHLTRVASKAVGTVAGAVHAVAVQVAVMRARPHRAVVALPAIVALALLAAIADAVGRTCPPFIARDDNARADLL